VSNPKVCPLLMAGILAGTDDRAGEKIQAGWDRCQGIDCAWWDKDRGECAVAPKWTTLTTMEENDE
jgi:hypothetical protein